MVGTQGSEIVSLAIDFGGNAPASRLYNSHHAFHEGTLAVAICTEQDNGFSGIHRHRDVLDNANRAVGRVHALDE